MSRTNAVLTIAAVIVAVVGAVALRPAKPDSSLSALPFELVQDALESRMDPTRGRLYSEPFEVETTAILVAGGRAYVGLGDRVAIYDVSDLKAAEFLGRPTKFNTTDFGFEGGINSLAISGHHLYVAVSSWRPPGTRDAVVDWGDGLLVDGHFGPHVVVVDVGDPRRPTVVGWLASRAGAHDLAIEGDTLLVAAAMDGVQVMSIADREHPRLVGQAWSGGVAIHLAMAGSRLLVGTVGNPETGAEPLVTDSPAPGDFTREPGEELYPPHRLVTLDAAGHGIQLPYPVLGTMDLDDEPKDILVDGRLAYVAVAEGLRILDTSDSARPRLVGELRTPSRITGLAGMIGSHIALFEWNSDPFAPVRAAQMIDLSEAAEPRVVGHIDIWDGARAGTVVDGRLFVAGGDGLNIFDVSEPERPVKLVGAAQTRSWRADVALDGHHAYVVDSFRGLEVLDLSEPSSPRHVAWWPFPPAKRNVFAEARLDIMGHHAIIAIARELFVVDIGEPLRPVLVGGPLPISDDRTNGVTGLVVAGDLAFVSTSDEGVVIIDASDPRAPTLAGTIPAYEVRGIVVEGSRAYIPTTDGLLTFDVSDPGHPAQVGTPDPIGGLHAAKHGRYLYSVDVFKGLLVLDVSDPTRPKQLGSGEILEGVNELETVGDSLFVLTESEGIQIHDLKRPIDLSPAATLDDPGYGLAMDVLGTLAVVVRGDGLQVLDLSDPLAPAILYDEESPG